MFENKVIVIIGAAGGIGQAIASRLAKEGARLVLTDVRRKELEKMAEALDLRDGKVLTAEHDVSRPEKVARAILRAAAGKEPEVLVPGVAGTFCRLSVAFPKLFFRLLPILQKIGRRQMVRRRHEQAEKAEVSSLEVKGSR